MNAFLLLILLRPITTRALEQHSPGKSCPDLQYVSVVRTGNLDLDDFKNLT